MKHLLLYLSLCLVGYGTIGQEANREYYEPISKRENTIVAINDSIAEVYTLVHIIDVAGRGNRLKKIDTLFKISNSRFLGPTYSLVIENESYLMNNNTGKELKIKLVESSKETNAKLNFAYYFGGYIDLSERIDNRYPHYHYSFRNGFYNWKKLSYKELDTKRFQELVKKVPGYNFRQDFLKPFKSRTPIRC